MDASQPNAWSAVDVAVAVVAVADVAAAARAGLSGLPHVESGCEFIHI